MARDPRQTICVVSPTDRSLMSLLEDAIQSNVITACTIYIGPSNARSVKSVDELKNVISELGSLDGRRVTFFKATTPEKWVVEFHRAIHNGSELIASSFEGQFWFDPQNHGGDGARSFLRVSELVAKYCASGSLEAGVSSPKFAGAMSTHIEHLASVALGISAELSKAQIAYDEKLSEHRQKLSDQFDADAETRKLEFSESLAKLKEEQDKLDAKSLALDMSRARDARRKLRDHITEKLEERLGKSKLSRSAVTYRWIVSALTLTGAALATFSAWIAVLSIAKVNHDTFSPGLALAYGRFVGSTALAAAFLFYLVGYLRKIEANDTRFERDLERFSLDINRASWIIETVMEFDEEEEGRSVPKEWLKRTTANLFSAGTEEPDDDDNALAALGELLKTGAKLKIGTNGAELELDKAAAIKVAKSGD